MVGNVDIADAHGRPSRLEALSAALSRRGHEVTIYTRGAGPIVDLREAASGYRIFRLPARRAASETASSTIDFADWLGAAWDIDPPDIVHAHSLSYGLPAQLAADRGDFSTVASFQPLNQWTEALLAKNAAWITVDCAETMRAHIQFGATRSKMSSLARGVDVGRFPRWQPCDRVDSRRIVLVAPDLSARHGVEVALHALTSVPTAELIIVGDGDDRLLRSLTAELGLGGRVYLYPMVCYDELPLLLLDADVVACLPQSQTVDSVALEAMAAGVPVIASACGELCHIVIDGITGLLVNPGSPGDLACALHAMFEDPLRRQDMALAGHIRATVRYGWDRIALDALGIYRKVLAETPDFALVTADARVGNSGRASGLMPLLKTR